MTPLGPAVVAVMEGFGGTILAQTRRPMFDWGWLGPNLGRIVDATLEHLYLTAASVGLGLATSLLLALLALRYRRLLAPILAVGGLLYTLPALAAFALLAALFGLRSAWVVILPLASYTLLILVRNIVIGIDGVSPDVVESAEGMGYRRGRLLLEIQLPLALPVVIAGVRIASVTVIGLVTVTALLGFGGLGRFILSGFRVLPEHPTQIIVGVALSIALAVAVDLLLLALERALTPWTRRRAVA